MGELLASLLVQDPIKPEARGMMARMQQLGEYFHLRAAERSVALVIIPPSLDAIPFF
jgi:hypothetical protein